MLYDIKQMDTASNKQHIGVPNERILTNLRRIGEYGISVEIRMPIIPGINDARETVRRAVRFLSDVEKITRVLLLPYHQRAACNLRQRSGCSFSATASVLYPGQPPRTAIARAIFKIVS